MSIENPAVTAGGIWCTFYFPAVNLELSLLSQLLMQNSDNIQLGVKYSFFNGSKYPEKREASSFGRREFCDGWARIPVYWGTELVDLSGIELRMRLSEIYSEAAVRLVEFLKKKAPEIDNEPFLEIVRKSIEEFLLAPPVGESQDDKDLQIIRDHFSATGKLHPLAIAQNAEAKRRLASSRKKG